MKLSVIDLFSGAGGLSEGFRQAGFDVKAATDIDPDACATYAHNFTSAEVIHGDIKRPEIHERIFDLASNVDVIIGGPPCQAFSQVRNHSRIIDDPRNSLYREFIKVLESAKPKAFLMENVPGMAQLGVRKQVEADLSANGLFNVRSQLVDAVDFGVPQTRKRLIFIGIRSDLKATPPTLIGTGASERISLSREMRTEGKFNYCLRGLQASLDGGASISRLLDPEDSSIVTVEQAIGDLQALSAGYRPDTLSVSSLPNPSSAYQRAMRSDTLSEVHNSKVPRINQDTALRLESIPEGGNYRDLTEELTKRYLSEQRWGPSNGSGKLGRKHYYAYRKLHRDFWAWTLNTKADCAYHYLSARALSVREFARLQSFPDYFQFITDARKGDLEGRVSGGEAHSKYRQVGNAVPPLLARHAASAILASIEIEMSKTAPGERNERLPEGHLEETIWGG